MSDGSLGSRLRRFFASHEELEAEELREQSVDCGAETLSSARPRSRVTLRGTITSLTSDAKNGWLEAEVTDGTGTVRLVWMGRDHIQCLIPGRHVRIVGRLASEDGKPVIYNPEFELL